MVMAKGITVAFRSVVVTLFMLLIVLYMFGVAFTQLTDGQPSGDKYFSRVSNSMISLLIHGILLEGVPPFFEAICQDGWLNGAVYLLFVLVAPWTILNMLVGVLVETVQAVSSCEREEMRVALTRERLLIMLRNLAPDKINPTVSKTEFHELLSTPEAARALAQMDVDVVGLVDLYDFIFENNVELDFHEFLEVVIQLRGSNKATVRDIVDLRKSVKQWFSRVESLVAGLEDPEAYAQRMQRRFVQKSKGEREKAVAG